MTSTPITTDAAARRAYSELLDAVLPLYAAGRYTDALALVRAAQPDLAARRADVAHLVACLLSLDGDGPGALVELQTAYDAGGWWERSLLEDDEDLAAVQPLPGFANLVEESERRTAEAQGQRAPDAVIVRPSSTPRVVLVALHGAGSDGADTAPYWQAPVDDGALLVAPYSSRRTTATHRTWPDLMVGSHDVERALTTADAPDGVPLVVGGFSAGGRQAMLMTLTANPEAPARFLAVCPALGRIQLDAGTARRAGERGVRGHVVLGEDDEAYAAVTDALALLNDAGVVTSLDVVAGLGHDYPSDFATRLREVLPGLLS